MTKIDPTKKMRDYQAKRRGGRSYISEIETLKEQVRQLEICLAWEAGELSEGTAAKMLGMVRVVARGVCNDAIARGAGYETMDELSKAKATRLKSGGGSEEAGGGA